MLLVKTFLAQSPIEGIGLFAGQDIKRGTVTWEFTPGFDLAFEKEEAESMPEIVRDYIKEYAALSMVSGKYILGSDNVRFTNHSNNPNLESIQLNEKEEKIARAIRDIKEGEEMTINYKTFDVVDASRVGGYLDS